MAQVQPAVFVLQSNTSKITELLVGTGLLNQCIAQKKNQKLIDAQNKVRTILQTQNLLNATKMGLPQVAPVTMTDIENALSTNLITPAPITLEDIEPTHLIPIQSEYRQSCELASQYMKIQSRSGKVTWGTQAIFDLPNVGHFFNDIVVNVTIDQMGNAATLASSAIPPTIGGPAIQQYYYCDYPGVRIFPNIALTIGGNPIDNYTPEAVIFRRQVELTTDKRIAFDVTMGQDVGFSGRLYQINAQAYQSASVFTGAQTPRSYQPPLDMWIPTQFWFNDNIKNSLCLNTVPFGQRFITFTIAPYADIVASVNSDGTIPTFTPPNITNVTLYTNQIFVDEAIFEIYMDSAAFTMCRLHLNQSTILTSSSGQIPLSFIKYPTETIYFGFRPVTNDNSFTNWYKFTYVNPYSIQIPVSINDPAGIGNPPLLVRQPLIYNQTSQVVQTVYPSAGSGVLLYPQTLPMIFYNDYLQVRGTNLVSPSDPGIGVLLFSQDPLNKYVVGTIDLSRIRDMFLNYDQGNLTPSITINNQVELVIITRSACNFLVIQGPDEQHQNAVLAFMT